MLTLRHEAKLRAGNHRFSGPPRVITHSAPLIVDANLHSSFTFLSTPGKSKVTVVAVVLRN